MDGSLSQRRRSASLSPQAAAPPAGQGLRRCVRMLLEAHREVSQDFSSEKFVS